MSRHVWFFLTEEREEKSNDLSHLGPGGRGMRWTLFGHSARLAISASRAKCAMRKGGPEPEETLEMIEVFRG